MPLDNRTVDLIRPPPPVAADIDRLENATRKETT
jgi:hypothetical protein